MVEIRFHGRGGQGSLIAATILGVAAFKEGKYCQSFGVFAAERRGAAVLAYTRISYKKIPVRCKVYKPDHVVVMDPTLVEYVDVTDGAKDGAWIVINSKQKPEEMGFSSEFKIATVDASAIAVKHGLGSPQAPFVNSAILGAFSKVTQILSLDATLEAIREQVPNKSDQNVAAARDAYELAIEFKGGKE